MEKTTERKESIIMKNSNGTVSTIRKMYDAGELTGKEYEYLPAGEGSRKSIVLTDNYEPENKGNFTWTLDEKGRLTISGFGEITMKNLFDVKYKQNLLDQWKY